MRRRPSLTRAQAFNCPPGRCERPGGQRAAVAVRPRRRSDGAGTASRRWSPRSLPTPSLQLLPTGAVRVELVVHEGDEGPGGVGSNVTVTRLPAASGRAPRTRGRGATRRRTRRGGSHVSTRPQAHSHPRRCAPTVAHRRGDRRRLPRAATQDVMLGAPPAVDPVREDVEGDLRGCADFDPLRTNVASSDRVVMIPPSFGHGLRVCGERVGPELVEVVAHGFRALRDRGGRSGACPAERTPTRGPRP